MNLEWFFKWLLPGDFIVLVCVFLWTWFLYKNFVKKVMDKIDNRVSVKSCLALREQCGIIVAERRNHVRDIAVADTTILTDKLNFIERKFDDKANNIDDKMNSVLEIQKSNQGILMKMLERK